MKRLKLLLVLVALGFIACDNENVPSDEISASLSVDSEIIIEEAESVLDDISIYSDSSFEIASTSKSSSSSKESSTTKDKRGRSGFFKNCADITIEEVNDTVTTTITFTDACEDYNGNIISGTIVKVKTKSDTSKERTITIQDLSINGYVVNGTKTYSYVTSNANGNPELVSAIDITIETDEGIISKVGTRTIEITAGGDTDICYDDEKTITGSSTFTNKSGVTVNVEITTPLVKPAGCKYIASGIKEYTTEAGTATVNFGDGTCDKVATKTAVDGTVTEIKIGKKRHH
ncbi:hypothetical protein [Thalassobellus sediminis]|uniref:hypothetical protein n=1 Tax=Thalassobellus sediminis TaxID=3367753 RepID=UPI003793479B